MILVLDLDDGTGHTLFTARRRASALAVRPVSHSRPILRKSGCPLVELHLPRKPASTDADQSQRFKPVIITEYGKDFRKYGYNSKRSKLDASF